jgi:ribosomal-protein-alanine N-acetyltransferase
MNILAETDRLILREILSSDTSSMYKMYTDPLVLQYLGEKPFFHVQQAEEVIEFIRAQYIANGTGRLAVIKKDTNEFIGWAGLKYVTGSYNDHTNYYEVGYRFIQKYWGKGYATEAARASIEYGFSELMPDKIYAMADSGNKASRVVLEKVGMRYVEKFDLGGIDHDWFEISRTDWDQRRSE